MKVKDLGYFLWTTRYFSSEAEEAPAAALG